MWVDVESAFGPAMRMKKLLSPTPQRDADQSIIDNTSPLLEGRNQKIRCFGLDIPEPGKIASHYSETHLGIEHFRKYLLVEKCHSLPPIQLKYLTRLYHSACTPKPNTDRAHTVKGLGALGTRS